MGDFGPQLDWIPVYIDRLLSSQKWRLMTDYERGWYWSLLVESVRSERVGYLRLDEELWRLAGARNKQFFEEKSARVLSSFKREELGGSVWIFNERLVQTVKEQEAKLNKSSSYSYSRRVFHKNSKEEVCLVENDISELEQATQVLLIKLGVAGMQGRVTCQDAIKSCSDWKRIGTREAAEEIVASWERYKAAPIKFRVTKVLTFLQNGVWKQEESWAKVEGSNSMGGW